MKPLSALFATLAIIFVACTSTHPNIPPTLEIVSANRIRIGSNLDASYEVVVRYSHADPKINYIESGFEYASDQWKSQGTLYHPVAACRIPSKNGEVTLVITRDKPENVPGSSPNGKIRAYLIERPSVPIPDTPFMSDPVVLAKTRYNLSEETANQPPRMPVSGTPAAGAPVAPPPGIAGR